MDIKDQIRASDPKFPTKLPESSESSFFLVLDDGETFGGAFNGRIVVVDDVLLHEKLGGQDVGDFDEMYEHIEAVKETIELPLDEVLSYLALNFGGFRAFVKQRRLEKIQGRTSCKDLFRYDGTPVV